MEKKPWRECSSEERNKLLNHWWYYYGKVIYTFDELQQFNKLIEKDSNKVWALAVGCYTMNLSSQPLIKAMRNDKVDSLLDSMPDLETINDAEFINAECEFMNMLLQSYNNPQPSIPMDSEEVKQQISDILKNKRK